MGVVPRLSAIRTVKDLRDTQLSMFNTSTSPEHAEHKWINRIIFQSQKKIKTEITSRGKRRQRLLQYRRFRSQVNQQS